MTNETNASAETSRLDWHSGFEGGLRLCLRRYADSIEIEREHYLSKEPLRIDFLLVKKDADAFIDNAIGRGFLGHNLIEYKNPMDRLDIDVLWKAIGYAALYKSFGTTVDSIKNSDITVSLFRAGKPVKMFKKLADDNKIVREESPGVYRIEGLVDIAVRIVVINELQDEELRALTVMVQNAREEDVSSFIQEASRYTETEDKRNADTVLEISTKVNEALYNKLKGDDSMCEALKELMADDLKEAENRGLEQGLEQGYKDRDTEKIMEMLKDGRTPEAISEFCKYPLEQVLEVQEQMTDK